MACSMNQVNNRVIKLHTVKSISMADFEIREPLVLNQGKVVSYL